MTDRLSVAPMMDWTDRHDRFFLRQITKRTLLYTEMVTSSALLYGNREQLLGFSPEEQPLAIQLGGSNPKDMAQAAKIAESYGYCEVNINVGCPSDRVQSGRFGACLMAEPDLVARIVEEISKEVSLPVTVKHRIGIDDLDGYEHLHTFVQKVFNAGCSTFIVHARKAWLKGLSPKENRTIPPLKYETVYQLKKDFPQLSFVINGGITTIAEIQTHLKHTDGVMIGREAYQNPYMLASVDHLIFDEAHPPRTRREILEEMFPYIEKMQERGVYLNRITRHMLGLFQGQPGARGWKRYLSEHAHLEGAGIEVLKKAAERVPNAVLDERISITSEL